MLIGRKRGDGPIVRQVLRGDRELFGELVDRYLNDAYALSRAYLTNRTDAEDAVQDAFLKAFKNLDSLRDAGKFCPWLLAIVRNTCLRYLTLRKREQPGLVETSRELAVNPDMERRDLHALLRTHVASLDPGLREVVLLHYFRGLDTSEISRRLDITRDAAKKRLQRARESLGATLLRELGDTLQSEAKPKRNTTAIMGALLAAPVAWQSAGAAAFTWSGALTAIGGTLLMAKKSVVVVLMVTGLAALFYATSRKDAPPPAVQPDSEIAPVAIASEPEAQDLSQVAEPVALEVPTEESPSTLARAVATQAGTRGRVIDEAGRPVEGAEVVMLHSMNRRGLDDAVLARTTTGTDGTYAIPVESVFAKKVPHAYAQDEFCLFAYHPNYAVGWTTIDQDALKEAYDIVVTKATSGTLTVIDNEGNPLEGAHVWLSYAGDRESAHPLFQHHFGISTDVGLISAFTDVEGKVTFDNLPDTQCSFRASKPGYAESWTPKRDGTIVLTKGATVSGRVVTTSGIPVPDALVNCNAEWMHDPHLTRTDSLGRYTFADMPANGWDMSVWESDMTGDGTYTLYVKDEKYTMPEEKIQLEPGDVLKDFDLTVVQGTAISCTVVWPDSGEPVPGVRMEGQNMGDLIGGFTDADGVFKFSAMPGDVRLYVYSPPDGVYFDEHVDVNGGTTFVASGETMDITLTAPPVAGKLIPAHGAVERGPYAFRDVEVYIFAGLYSAATSNGYMPPSVKVDANTGAFNLDNVPAGRTLLLYAITDDRSYAGISRHDIPADAQQFTGLAVSLQPTQSGAVVLDDGAGTPYAGIEVVVEPVFDENEFAPARRTIQTDAQGRMELDGVIPGLTYHLFNWDLHDETTGQLAINTSMVIVPEK